MLKRIIETNRTTFIITIVIVLFIWTQSVIKGEISSAESGTILNIINSIFNIDMNHTLLRKLGHITEYTALGISLSFLTRNYTRKYYIQSVFVGLLVAFIDESIQVFTPDRGPLITDVWIDTGGVFLGIVIASIIAIIIMKRKLSTR